MNADDVSPVTSGVVEKTTATGATVSSGRYTTRKSPKTYPYGSKVNSRNGVTYVVTDKGWRKVTDGTPKLTKKQKAKIKREAKRAEAA